MFIWNKWIIPGIIVVAALTLGTFVFLTDPIENDLSERISDSISTKHPWAEISVKGRDIALRGTAPVQSDAEDAINIINSTVGVRQVKNEADLLPVVSPHPFSAELADGTVTLSGNAPNIQSREALLKSASEAFPVIALPLMGIGITELPARHILMASSAFIPWILAVAVTEQMSA